MQDRTLLATAPVPDTTHELRLYQSGEVFSVKIPGRSYDEPYAELRACAR